MTSSFLLSRRVLGYTRLHNNVANSVKYCKWITLMIVSVHVIVSLYTSVVYLYILIQLYMSYIGCVVSGCMYVGCM